MEARWRRILSVWRLSTVGEYCLEAVGELLNRQAEGGKVGTQLDEVKPDLSGLHPRNPGLWLLHPLRHLRLRETGFSTDLPQEVAEDLQFARVEGFLHAVAATLPLMLSFSWLYTKTV